MTKYRLEMNEEQARTVIAALDFWVRMRLGQWRELAELCIDWEPGHIEENCLQRDELEDALSDARKIVMPDLPRNASWGVYKFESTERAFNILKAVRSAIAWHKNPQGGYEVIYDRPRAINVTEEMPTCEVVEDEAHKRRTGGTSSLAP